jgi:hypothetical protein
VSFVCLDIMSLEESNLCSSSSSFTRDMRIVFASQEEPCHQNNLGNAKFGVSDSHQLGSASYVSLL